MQTVLPSEFKRMMALMLDGAPYIIEDFHVSGTAQTRHKLHVRLKHLLSGRFIEKVFAENERVPLIELETKHVTYSYSQGGTHVFMDVTSFEELDLNDEQLGERRWFLKEEQEYKVLMLDGRVADLIVPAQIPLKVIDTAAPVRGATDTAWKEAKLETGLQIMVPLFISKGETIRVDTVEKKYAGREN
jgi:elongation factor P